MSIRSLADFNDVRPSVGPVLARTDTVTGRGTPAVDQVNEVGTFSGHTRGLSHGHGHDISAVEHRRDCASSQSSPKGAPAVASPRDRRMNDSGVDAIAARAISRRMSPSLDTVESIEATLVASSLFPSWREAIASSSRVSERSLTLFQRAALR